METLTHTEEVQKLFIRNMGPIRGIIIGMVTDLSLAEDVLQEVFLVVTRKADDFVIGTNFMAWVRAIARLKVMELVRQKGNLPCLLGEEALEAIAGAAPVEDDAWERRRKALADCLKSLPPRAGRIMSLRYADGLDPRRIARQVSWSVVIFCCRRAVNTSSRRRRRRARRSSINRSSGGAGRFPWPRPQPGDRGGGVVVESEAGCGAGAEGGGGRRSEVGGQNSEVRGEERCGGGGDGTEAGDTMTASAGGMKRLSPEDAWINELLVRAEIAPADDFVSGHNTDNWRYDDRGSPGERTFENIKAGAPANPVSFMFKSEQRLRRGVFVGRISVMPDAIPPAVKGGRSKPGQNVQADSAPRRGAGMIAGIGPWGKMKIPVFSRIDAEHDSRGVWHRCVIYFDNDASDGGVFIWEMWPEDRAVPPASEWNRVRLVTRQEVHFGLMAQGCFMSAKGVKLVRLGSDMPDFPLGQMREEGQTVEL